VQLIKSVKSFLFGEVKALTGSVTIQAHNQIYPTWDAWKNINVYRVIDDVYSVVNRLSSMAASVPMWGYKMGAKNEQEDLDFDAPLAKFLRSLTYVQRIELYKWLFINGEVFIYKEFLIGANAGVTKMHFLNPNFITLILSDTFPEKIVKYKYQDGSRGLDFILELEDVIFLRYLNPNNDVQKSWRGLSPINALAQRLTRLKSGMDVSVAQMQNGGTPGVLSLSDLPNNQQSASVVGAMKDNWSRFISNSDNKGAPFMQAGKMEYTAIGSPLADLSVAELANIDFKKICNAYQISDILFNSDSASTESNVIEMRQMAWTNAIIPNLVMVEDAFNQELVNHFNGSFMVKYDLSSIKDLQKSLKDTVDALAAAPVMIPNDVLEAMGYARSEDTTMDEPMIKTGYVTLSEITPIDPLDA